MISHKYKCIFIHISKCAGTSVENAFGVYKDEPDSLGALRGWDDQNKLYLQHATPQQLLDLNLVSREHWDSYYKFVIYRNSWSKLLSDYSWVSRVHKIEDSFENFLFKRGGFEMVLNNRQEPTYCGDHLYLQKDYFFLDGQRILYDTEIDFDDIEKGFDKVINDLSLDAGFFDKKHNATQYEKQHYSYSYSLKTNKLVKKIYQKDIDFFDFTFERKYSSPLNLKFLLKK